MFDKLSLNDREYDIVSKGIAIGTGSGIALGAIFNNITLFFALGGVISILISLIYAKKHKVKEVLK